MRIIYLGFFKLTLLNTPLAYNDGDKMIQVKFDYCSFSSGMFSIRLSNKIKYHIITDWSAKKELYISMLLRAYSQGRFDPETIFDEDNSEDVFVNKIEDILKEYIRQEIATDSNAIRKEIINLHNVVKENKMRKNARNQKHQRKVVETNVRKVGKRE